MIANSVRGSLSVLVRRMNEGKAEMNSQSGEMRGESYRFMRRLRDFSILLVLASAPSAASAQLTFIEWTSTADGSGGGITATVNSTVTLGSIGFQFVSATDPVFVANYESSYSVLTFKASTGGPGDITSAITFSTPLPVGARLIASDVDYNGETLTLTTGGVGLALFEQLETMSGESSTFPSYDNMTGELVGTGAVGNNNPNNSEATVFDVSGLSAIQVSYDNGINNTGVAVGILFPPPPPVPAFSSPLVVIFLFGLLGLFGAYQIRHYSSHH
ncbi:MAG: hypothetical protein ACI9QQ_001309 [Myxococcota bacterium]